LAVTYASKKCHLVNHSSQNLVRVREMCAREISLVSVAAGTSPYLGLNGALRPRGGGELQIDEQNFLDIDILTKVGNFGLF